MPCPRCGEDRLIYDVTLVKRFPSGETMERSWLLCQSCIAEVIALLNLRKAQET